MDAQHGRQTMGGKLSHIQSQPQYTFALNRLSQKKQNISHWLYHDNFIHNISIKMHLTHQTAFLKNGRLARQGFAGFSIVKTYRLGYIPT